MEIFERLQDLRRQHKFSQEDIADKLGVSRQAVSKWESGQGKPEINNIIKLAEIYGVTTDYLLLGKEDSSILQDTIPQEKPDRTLKKTIAMISVIGATALITVLFITLLFFLGKFVFSA